MILTRCERKSDECALHLIPPDKDINKPACTWVGGSVPDPGISTLYEAELRAKQSHTQERQLASNKIILFSCG